MEIKQTASGRWVIWHGGRLVDAEFATEAEAWAWADRNIDDQVFGEPNWFSGPIKYVAEPTGASH